MKKIMILFLISVSFLTVYGQKYKYPGQLEIRGYRIGQKVDTTNFKKYGNLYFPNYLDGWTMNNVNKLPKKYAKLPISIWQLKSDSSVALTLLDNVVMNIIISNIKKEEQEKLSKMLSEKFGADGQQKAYEQSHPLQSWITYWDLTTWETKDVIFQIGNSDMRMPNDELPKDIRWNLVYSDFLLEKKIISDYGKR